MEKPEDMPQGLWEALPPGMRDMLEGAIAVPVEVSTKLDFSNPITSMAWLDSWVSAVIRLCEQDKEKFDVRITLLSSTASALESIFDECQGADDLHKLMEENIVLARRKMIFLREVLTQLTEHPEEAPPPWQPHLETITQIIRTDLYETGPMMVAVLLKADELAGHWASHPMAEGA